MEPCGSSQGGSRGNSPASVYSSHSQFYSQPHGHSRSRSQSQSRSQFSSHLHPHSTSPPSSAPQASSLPFPHTQSLIMRSFADPHTPTSQTRDDMRYRRVSFGTESRFLGSETLARSYGDDPLTPSRRVSLSGDSTPLDSTPKKWWGGVGRLEDDWDSRVEGGGWGRGDGLGDERGRHGLGEEGFGSLHSDSREHGRAEVGDGFRGENGLLGSGFRDQLKSETVFFKDEELRSSLVRDEGVGLPSSRDGFGSSPTHSHSVNIPTHTSLFHDGLGSLSLSIPKSGYPSPHDPLFSGDFGDGFGSASVPLGYSRHRKDSFGDGYGFGWEGYEEDMRLAMEGRSLGTNQSRNRSQTANWGWESERRSEEGARQGFQSLNRHLSRESFGQQQQHRSPHRLYEQEQEYEHQHSHPRSHQPHRVTRDRSFSVHSRVGSQILSAPLIADGLGDGMPRTDMRLVMEDGWGFEGRVGVGDQGGTTLEDGWNERLQRARWESGWGDRMGVVYEQNSAYDRGGGRGHERRNERGHGRVRRISDASISSASSSENGGRYEGSGHSYMSWYGERQQGHGHGHSRSLPITPALTPGQFPPGLPSSQLRVHHAHPHLHAHSYSYSGSQSQPQSYRSLSPSAHHSHYSGVQLPPDSRSRLTHANASANTSSTVDARAYINLGPSTQSPQTYPSPLSDPSPGTRAGNIVPSPLLAASQPALGARGGQADPGVGEVSSGRQIPGGAGSPASVHLDSVKSRNSRSSMLLAAASSSVVSGDVAQSSTTILSASSSSVATTSQPLSSPSMDLHSKSQTDTFPSLSSLGIGFEEGESEGKRSRMFWWRKRAGSGAGKRVSKDETKAHSKDRDRGDKDDRDAKNQDNRVHGDKDECLPKDPPVQGHMKDVKMRVDKSDSPRNGLERLEGVPGALELQKEAARADNVQEGDQGARVGEGEDHDNLVKGTESKDTGVHEKEKEKHGSFFSRSGTKSTRVADEQKDGHDRVEKHVSLVLMSILPASTIRKLSPAGEALLKAGHAASSIGHSLAPVIKEGLVMSTDVLKFAPVPGLEEAARVLLGVWQACEKVDTNRLSCLRLTERCATLLYSVRSEIVEAGEDVAKDLAEPIERLCDALNQIRAFLETQLHRPFLKRYLRRDEISRELMACNRAITDVGSMFGMSIQIRTLKQVYAAASESRRFEHQLQFAVQGQFTQSNSITQGSEAASALQAGNALGLMMGNVSVTVEGDGGYSTPPPAYRSPSPMVLDNGATPLTDLQSVGMGGTDFPLHALADLHQTQNVSDAAADVAALRRTLMDALNAGSDVELLRSLQVGRGEIPEAVRTLKRVLEGHGSGGSGAGYVHEMGKIDTLDREFMENGINVMARLSNIGVRIDHDNSGMAGEEGIAPLNLPNWTITRYEVDRTRKIGIGFFSDVYLGRWRAHTVAIKVLAPTTPRSLFVREINIWRSLEHPNILPLYGASSAMGDRPWFFVSRLCSGGSLVEWLRRAKMGETEDGGLGARGRSVYGGGRMGRAEGAVEARRALGGGSFGREMEMGGNTNEEFVDLLRCMHQIAKGMEYLHGREVLHGDLKAANVLVDETGRCLISDFGQSEMKSEAYRLSGQPTPRGTLRWQAPELLLGDNRLTNAVDTYAFAICCVEILGMGDLPWAMLDDRAVASLVLDKDQRPPLPKLGQYTNIANTSASLIQSCWDRDPDTRPSFVYIAASLAELRRREGHGGDESPFPLSLDEVSDGIHARHKRVHSAEMRCTSLSFINMESSSLEFSSSSESPADEHYETASENTPVDMEEETFAMPGSLDMPPTGSRRVASHTSPGHVVV
ncbi:hypothetical protein BDN67DRAFT_932949 [Paxillus ammoniavirescens]|nr:hypothetical protein BDN67DRAFT_932949 [Paxillus ammoniavirescens]